MKQSAKPARSLIAELRPVKLKLLLVLLCSAAVSFAYQTSSQSDSTKKASPDGFLKYDDAEKMAAAEVVEAQRRGWSSIEVATRGKYEQEKNALVARALKGDTDAQYVLGVGYSAGRYGPKDGAMAVKWFRMGADKGDPGCQDLLAGMYEEGNGVPQDYAEALRWYRKSADQGGISAQAHLAWMYYRGERVAQDYTEALRWARAAAGAYLGNQVRAQVAAEAQALLYLMYSSGEGVPQDYVAAHAFINLAASNSTGEKQKRAVAARDAVAGMMTPEQIAEAQRLAREWSAKTSQTVH